MPPTLAARWRTISAPSTAARVCAGSRRSCSAERTGRTSAPTSARRAVTLLPRKPAPPVTTTGLPSQNPGEGSDTALTDAHGTARELVLERLQIGVTHDLHQLRERHRRLPAEPFTRLGVVAAQCVDLGRAEVARIDLHVL